MTRAEYLIAVAKECQDDVILFLRYMRKEFDGTNCRISTELLDEVLESGELLEWQAEIIKQACIPNSAVARYLIGLNEKAKTPILDHVKRKLGISEETPEEKNDQITQSGLMMPVPGFFRSIILELDEDINAMYSYMTLNDGTEIMHSPVLSDIDGKKVIIYFKRPSDLGFDEAIWELPSYKQIAKIGFSESEMENFFRFLHSNEHLFFKYAEKGGIGLANPR